MICVNNAVFENYKQGHDINEAIRSIHNGEIQDKIKDNPDFGKLSPLQMVMHDAGITKNSNLEEIMHPKNTMYTSGGMESNEWLFPVWMETTIRETQYERSMLPYIVNTTISIDGNTVQSPMLNLLSEKNKPALRKARIAEGADLPTGKITMGEKAITLWKHGRAIELTYEAARRMRIDLFTRHMNAIIADITDQNMGYATDVLANGDGNPDTAAVKIGSVETTGKISAQDIIHGMFEYEGINHFAANTIVMPRKYLESVSQLMYDPTLAVGAGMQISFDIPQMANQRITIIGNDNAKIGNKEAIIYLDRNTTLIRYEENGSNIREMENFIRNQTRLMTMSENSGYSIGTAGSNMYQEITA